MTSGEDIIHVFNSSGAARLFSSMTGEKAQGIVDLLREMSSSVNVKNVSDEESLIALLKAGAPVEDLLTIKTILTFLKSVGETTKIHKLISDDISEKKVEKYSEITVNYYKEISKTGKSEVEDFSEFMNLFPLKYDLQGNYVSHLTPSLKPFFEMFHHPVSERKINSNVVKKKFPDYWAEYRWIARDILLKKGRTCVVAPDDLAIINVVKELELYGIKPSVVSAFPVFMLNESPVNFILSAIRSTVEDFSFESMMSLLENPFCDVEPFKLQEIKDACYKNNITGGIHDWKTLFQELKIGSHILNDVESLQEKNGTTGELEELMKISHAYLSGFYEINNIINLLNKAFPDYSEDLAELINDINSLKFWPRCSSQGEGNVIVGKPVDVAGLEFDTVYLSSLDSASSFRAFTEDARDYLDKIGLKEEYVNLENTLYRKIMESSNDAILTFSFLDDKLSYTESTPFYDEVDASDEYVSREHIFEPSEALVDWEVKKNGEKREKYSLSPNLIKSISGKPIYPTFLENYIGCHFKAYVNGLLGIDEIDPPLEFLDPRTTGSLTHKILERYYSTELSPKEFNKLAEGHIKYEISRERYESRIAALKFYRDKFLSSGRLTRFFVMDVKHAQELGRRTVQKEFRFPSNNQEVIYDFDSKKVSIGGIVDRIDDQNGNLVVIDYKSSLYGYPKNELCDQSHGKIQLYFYKLGVESVFKKKVTAAAYVSFRDISDGFSTAGFFHAIPNEESEIKKCKLIVDPTIESYLNGDFDPVVKEGGSLWACENLLFCPLLSVCRVQERRW